MSRRIVVALGCLVLSGASFAAAEDDPLLFKVMVDKLEWREAEGDNPVVWDAEAWAGKDLNKLWLKTEGEYADGRTEAGFAEALYSRAVSAYWDLQVGWRHDFRPRPNRDWFAIGFQGLAPYWFEVDATLYAGGNGTVFGRFQDQCVAAE